MKNFSIDHTPVWFFFGRTTFLELLKKMSYFHAFFLRKIIIFCLKNKIIFSGKRNIIFPDDTRNIIFHCRFLERPSSQNIWKKKTWFFVQCADYIGQLNLVWSQLNLYFGSFERNIRSFLEFCQFNNKNWQIYQKYFKTNIMANSPAVSEISS